MADACRVNRSKIGHTLPVLFDREGKFDGQMLGKSPYMQSVHVQGAALQAGKIVDVEITAAYQNSLAGEIVENGTRRKHVG